MPVLKRILTLALVGAALGFILWSIIGQGAVSILFGSLGGSVNCGPDVELGLQKFVHMQLYCALFGAAMVPLAVWLFKRKRATGAAGTGPTPSGGSN